MGKTFKKAVLAAVVLLLLSSMVSAQSILGYWKSINEEGEPTAYWHFTERGGMLFGRVVNIVGMSDDELADKVDASYPQHPESRALNTMRVLDVDWIYNMESRRRSSTEYTGGWIIDPESGKRYNLDLNVLPPNHRNAVDGQETLEVKGKILMFSKSQYWVRSSASEF